MPPDKGSIHGHAPERQPKAENLLSSFPELNPNPVVEVDLRGHVNYANPAAQKLLPDLVSLGSAHPFLADWDSVASQCGRAAELPTREVLVGDRWYQQAMHFVPAIKSVRVYGLDITDRKKAETQLLVAEAKCRTLVEQINDWVWEVDVEGRYTYSSPRVRDLLGYEPQEVLGKTPFDFMAPECIDRVRAAFIDCVRRYANIESLENTAIGKDGRRIVLETSGVPIIDRGHLVGYRGIDRDVTQRVMAVAALQEANQRTTAILESITDGFFSLDNDLVVTYFNSAAERMLHRESAEVLGRKLLDVFPEARGSVFEDFYRRGVAEKVSMSLEAYFGVAPYDGWYDVRVYPRRDGISVFFQNITLRKQTEEALQQRVHELAAINALSRLVSSSLSIDQVATAALQGVLDAVNPSVAFLFLREGGERLVLKALLPEPAKQRLETVPEHRVGECMCGLAVRDNVAVYSRNLLHDLRCTWHECKKAGMVSFASLPLRDGPEVIGVIGLGSDFERDFKRQESFLDTLASQVSVAFTNARLFERVRNELAYRKEAQEAVRISEERLRQATRVAKLGIFDHDQLKDVIQWSPEMMDICGFQAGQVFALDDWIRAIHPDDRARITETIRTAHDPAGTGLYEVEHRIIRRDGQQRWLSVRSQTFFEGQGQHRKAVRTIGAVLDVTESRRVEEALRRKSEELERYFMSALDLLCIADINGNLVKVNPEWERALGYSRLELEGKEFLWLVHPDDRRATIEAVKHLAENQQILTFVNRFQHRDGDYRWLEWRAQMFEGLIYAVGRDITDRRHDQEALANSERRLSTLISNLPGIAYRCGNDPSWTMEFISNGCLALTGYPASDLMHNARMSYADIVHPDDREAVWKQVQSALSEKRPFELIYRIATAQRDVKWVWEKGCGVYDAQGNLEALEGFITDITDRKRDEESLKKYSSELEQSNRDLEQFAYVASHDLQEPLRMVTSFLSLLRDYCGQRLDQTANEYIGFACEGGTRMKDLIDGLLAYSRISTRAQPSSKVDVQTVLEGALSNLKAIIDEAGAVITHDPMPIVNADGIQMTQLFQNLLSNAVKFHNERKPVIHVGVRQEKDAWLFSVRDNGIGIDPQFKERIFQIFQRLHTRDKFPGMGIGLAICKKIVDRHGGRIWVESEPGKGSIFYFTIPRR